jgi:hypothetical protein
MQFRLKSNDFSDFLVNQQTSPMRYPIHFVIFLFISILFWECKKSSQSCGCDSPVVDTYDSISGTLEYDPYLKQYSILAGGTNVDGRGNIICDTTVPGLQPFLDSARIFSAAVTFSAQIKIFCYSDTNIYIGERRNINITKISYWSH